MCTKKTISFLLTALILASVLGCGGGGQTTITSSADGSGGGATGSAALAWDAPTTNVDGTPITALAGFRVYYGTASGVYTGSIDVGNVTDYSLAGFAAGTYYFAVTAYDAVGDESGFSNEVRKTIL